MKYSHLNLCVWVVCACATSACAQLYPTKPIRVILSVPAGGTPDVLARTITPGMAAALGQQLVLDNRGGAGGRIAAELVAGAAPDGYTVFMSSPPCLTILPHVAKVPYDTFKDFMPVSLLASGPMVLLTHAASPISSAKDLIARAKAAPGKLNYSTAGNGTANHIGMEVFKGIAGINITHVPYAGSPQSVIDLIAGRVDVMYSSIPLTLPHVKAGRLRTLAIASASRSALMPEVPTMDEATGLRGVLAGSWIGLLVPAATPAAIVARLNDAAVQAVRNAGTRARLLEQGSDPIGNSSREFAIFLRADYDRNGAAVKLAGLKID